jgi:hypothetical protein
LQGCGSSAYGWEQRWRKRLIVRRGQIPDGAPDRAMLGFHRSDFCGHHSQVRTVLKRELADGSRQRHGWQHQVVSRDKSRH